MPRMSQIQPGDRFGRWVVLAHPEGPSQDLRSLCKCDCGTERAVNIYSLRAGYTASCGCVRRDKLRAQNTTHGLDASALCASSEYRSWRQMHRRCSDTARRDFRHYGGRGISVCSQWTDFEVFMKDMGAKPTPEHSLDRINVNGNYEPTNCRWATQTEQVRNTRASRIIEHDGISLCIAEWTDRLGFPKGLIGNRLYRGWDERTALTTPIIPNGYRSTAYRQYPNKDT